MSEDEVSRYCYHTSSKSRKIPEVTRYAYALFNKFDFEHLGKALPPGCGIDSSLGKRIATAGDDDTETEGTTSNVTTRPNSRRTSGTKTNNSDESDHLSAALREMSAKEDAREKDKADKEDAREKDKAAMEKNKVAQELNLRRLEIILKYGNDQQKDAAMNELLEMQLLEKI